MNYDSYNEVLDYLNVIFQRKSEFINLFGKTNDFD